MDEQLVLSIVIDIIEESHRQVETRERSRLNMLPVVCFFGGFILGGGFTAGLIAMLM